MDDGVLIIAIVVGIPVIGSLLYAAYEHSTKMRLKMSEIELERDRLRLEEKLKTDELNAKILRMDDLGMSPTDLAALSEQVRQLREEVAGLKQELHGRVGGTGA